MKTWEEIKAERTKSSATKTQKSWAEIKKERGYVEPQSSIKEEQAAGATPALPAGELQQQRRSSGLDLIKSNSDILQGKSTAPIGTISENPFISEGKRLQDNVENAKTALAANGGSKEYRDQLAKAAEEYERWKQQHPAFAEEVEPAKVGKFLLEKGASGAAESSEGFLNAMSRIGQMRDNQLRQQSLEGQSTAAFLLGDKEQSAELLQQAADAGKIAYGRDQQLVMPFEFGDRYAAKVEEKYADANLSKGQRFLGDVAQGVGGLVPSIAANVVAPGSGMVVMTAGAFGNAVQEAKKAGADDATANAYGVAVGAVEAVTEKIWGGMGGLFGKGPVDDLVKNAIANNIKSGAARAALTTAVSMFGEGVEEFLAEYGQLIANKLSIKTDDRKVWSRETLGDAGKSALIGAIIGGIMNIGESIEAGKTPQQAVETAAEEAAEEIKKEMPAENAEATAKQETEAVKIAAGGEETVADNDTDETALKAAEEKLKKAVETNRAKAAEREEEIPKIELKGIKEEQTTNIKSEEEIPRIELPGIEETAKVPAKAGNESQRNIARRIGDYIEENEPERISPAELGIKDGGRVQNIAVLDKQAKANFDFSEADAIAKKAGYEPVYYSGMMQKNNGESTRWGIAGNKLYIQADSVNYTAADIAREATERRRANAEQISDRGQQRYAGINTGRQTERIYDKRSRHAEQADARADKAKNYAVERASDYIRNGSQEQTLKIIPAENYDEELQSISQGLQQMGIKNVHFTVGSIDVVDPKSGKRIAVSGVYNTQTGAMLIRADSPNYSARELALHESFHFMSENNPQMRKEALQYLIEEISEKELDALIAKYQEIFGNIYGDNVDAYVEEILADAYAGINRNNTGANQYRKEVRAAVFATARPETERQQTRGPNERYSFAGVRAKIANYASLQEAKNMETEGADKETIRQNTGWYRGADNRWRFEIDDSEITLKDPDNIINYMTLGELIDAPQLFAAYPDMANIDVVFQSLFNGAFGQYNRQFDSIDLAYGLKSQPEKLLNSLLHEIQHAVQNREQFAHGASVEYWEKQIEQGYDSRTQMQREEASRLWAEYNALRENEPEFMEAIEELTNNAPNVPRGTFDFETFEQIEEDPIEWQEFDAKRDALEAQYGDLKVWDAMDLYDSIKRLEMKTGRSAAELYYDTAGEIEARDVAGRRTLNAEERRARKPYTGNADTVFAGNGWTSSEQSNKTPKSFEVHKYYNRIIKNIEAQNPTGYTIVGRIPKSGALYEVGFPSGDVYFDNSKILNELQNENDPLPKEYMQRVPEILENPIVIVESNKKNTASVFGEVWKNNVPVVVGVMVAKDRSGRNVITKVRTVHTRGRTQSLINDDTILYLNKNKNKTKSWFQASRITMPLGGTQFGLIRTLPLTEDVVKPQFSVEENQTAERDKELDGILSDLQAATEENAVKAETATEGKKPKEIISVKPVATADEAIERKLLNAEAEAAEEEAPEKLVAKMSNSRGDFTASPAIEKLGVKVVNSIGRYNNVKQLISNVKASHSLAAARKKAETRLKVTAKEKLFARGIANGTYSESDIPEGWDKRTVLEMSEWYMAERNFGESYIDKLKQALAVDLDAATAQMFEGIDESKVSPAIVLNHRTVQRNMLKIFGAEKGAEINRWLFDPVNQNEAERIRFINRQYDKVRTFEDQSGKQRALSKEEREMVQRVMEGRVVLDAIAELENKQDIYDATDNLLAGEDIGDLGLEFGLTLEEQEIVESYANWLKVQDRLAAMDNTIINNAVEKYTALFDDYYDAINDFLAAHGYQPIGFIKGYVPHLQPEKNQTALQSAFEKLGFNADVSTLPASIAGLTGEFKPNKKWNPYFLHRNGTTTQFDIVEAFESYVSHMADMLYHMDDIMRIRNAVKYFRRTYSPEEIRNSIEWAENLRTMPKSERVAFLYDEGIISASTGEISNADSKELLNKYIDDMYGKIENTSKFNNLVVYLENYANILAGKQSIADRGEEASLGRKILNVGNKITRIFSRANVAGNISSALNQSSQLPMILAENGIRNTSAAFKDIVTGNLRKQGWAEDSDYLTTKKGVDFIVSTPGEMFVDVIFKPMELVDGMVSTLAVRSSYLNAIKRGMSHEEAMQYADRKAVNIMGDRSKGAKPLAFESKKPISSMLHMFQVEALNSWDHLISDLPSDFRQIEATEGKNKAAAALAGVIVKTLISTFALNRLAEKLYGGTPAPFDIFGLTANFIASGQSLGTNSYLEALIDKVMMELFGTKLFDTDDDELELLADEEFDTAAAFEDLGYNLSNEIPFLSNLSALLGLGDKTLPLPDLTAPAKTITSGIKNKNVLEALDGAVEALGEIVPAGRQAVKTYTGAKTIIQGGKMKGYGEKARLQYPVRRTAGNITQALLFGTSGLQENQDYYASGRGSLTAKETMLWKTLVANGADEEEAYKVIYSTKGEDVKDYEKLQIMAAPTEWDNDLKYEAMISVVNDSAGYKIRVLQNYEISADLYAEATAAMYDAATERIAELPEDERPERVNITQEDAKKVLKAMSGISNQEKAIIWQMTNAGWAVGKNPFSSTVGKKAKAEYEEIKERTEREEEIPSIQLAGVD